MTENSILRFAPFSSFISSSFWFKFADIKLDNDRLQEVERCIWGYYSHCEKSGAVLIDCTSFNKEPDICFSRRYCYGYHVNKNTIEGLKNCSRSALIDKYGRFIIERIKNGEAIDDPNLLVTFILLSFCDLKKYVFTYWFAFPAPLHPSFLLCDSPKKLNSLLSSSQSSQLHQLYLELPENQKGFFCFQLQYQGVSIFELKNVLRNIDDFRDSRNEIYFSFVDPSVLDEVPGWPLRNYLFLIKTYCAEVFNNEFKIVSIRGEFPKWVDLSYVFKIRVAETENDCVGKTEAFVGWQRNDEGKLNFKRINLSDEMDPKKLSNCAVSLNLKLVKWRLQPDLDLSILKNTSCLLLGAGTLGCSVARILLAWGIEKITFVDNGIVSYSNPARQSLYTLEDSAKGCYKANAAARSLYLIHPGMTVAAEVLEIPIPGNKFYKSDHVTKLIELIKNHDAVFLLTDSRESRWLPTLLCSLYQKIAITIALGYDSYLVIRHGVASSSSTEKLGCYFCNDVVAPGNSSVDRTLDQQCTVTRPGLSGIASSFGVELFVSLLQHAKKGQASANSTSCLGKIPHSIRGFIADYEQMLPFTPAFNQCIACSPRVLGEYEREKEVFLQKVFTDRKYLEEVTALTLYYSVDDKIEFPESSDSDE